MLSALFGVVLAFFLPPLPFITGLAELTIRLGRFLAFPLLFSSLAVAVCQLRRSRQLLQSLKNLFLFSLGTAVIFTLLPLILSAFLPLARIPILSESTGWQSMLPFQNEILNPGLGESLRLLIPVNVFEIFQNHQDIILPALLFAFFLGTQLYHDREEAEPVFNFFDSFSRMFFRMNVLFTKLLAFTLFSLSYVTVLQIRSINAWEPYISLLSLVIPSGLLILFGLQPLLYYLLSRKNPYREMKVFFPALIPALFTGDSRMNTLVTLRLLKENGGMKRKITALTLPFLTLFSKGGTAMVAAVSMLSILKSYSSLELTAFQILLVALLSIFSSFLLFSQSWLSVYTAVMMVCRFYGRGLEDGYVLVLPIMTVLVPVAEIINTANNAWISLLFSTDKDFRIPEAPGNYI